MSKSHKQRRPDQALCARMGRKKRKTQFVAASAGNDFPGEARVSTALQTDSNVVTLESVSTDDEGMF